MNKPLLLLLFTILLLPSGLADAEFFRENVSESDYIVARSVFEGPGNITLASTSSPYTSGTIMKKFSSYSKDSVIYAEFTPVSSGASDNWIGVLIQGNYSTGISNRITGYGCPVRITSGPTYQFYLVNHILALVGTPQTPGFTIYDTRIRARFEWTSANLLKCAMWPADTPEPAGDNVTATYSTATFAAGTGWGIYTDALATSRFHFLGRDLDSFPSIIIPSTYNISSGVDSGNQTVWRTNLSSVAKIADTSPTIIFETSNFAVCAITDQDENLTTAMSAGHNGTLCSENSGNATSQLHTCTPTELLAESTKTYYIACGTYSSGYVSDYEDSASGELQVSCDSCVTAPPLAIAHISPQSGYEGQTLQASCYMEDDSGNQINSSWVVYENSTNISQGTTEFVNNATNVSVYNWTAQKEYFYNLTCTPTNNESTTGATSQFNTSVFEVVPGVTLCQNISTIQFYANISRGNLTSNLIYTENNIIPRNASICGYTYMFNLTGVGSPINYTFYSNLTSNYSTLRINHTNFNATKNATIYMLAGTVEYFNVTMNFTNVPLLENPTVDGSVQVVVE